MFLKRFFEMLDVWFDFVTLWVVNVITKCWIENVTVNNIEVHANELQHIFSVSSD